LITQILKDLQRELLYLDIGLQVNTNGHKLLSCRCSTGLLYKNVTALSTQRSAAASF